VFFFFFSSRRRHTRFSRDWSSDVCSSDLIPPPEAMRQLPTQTTANGNGAAATAPSTAGDDQNRRRSRSFNFHSFKMNTYRKKRRSEERRVGKECRSRWAAHHEERKRESEA